MEDEIIYVRFHFVNGSKKIMFYTPSKYERLLDLSKQGLTDLTITGQDFVGNGRNICFFEKIEEREAKKKWYQWYRW